MKITGYPIVFGERSVDLGGFIEIIAPSAVDRTLRHRSDVVALHNHDSNHPLGRTSAGTLTLVKDTRGLAIDLNVDDDVTYASDLVHIIRRGDAIGGSFAFQTVDDTWQLVGDVPLRTVLDMHVREVSVAVPFPAYPATTLQARAAAVQSDSRLIRGTSIALAQRRLRQALAR